MKAIIQNRHTSYKWLVIFAVLLNLGKGMEIGTPDDEPWTGRWMPDRPNTESSVNLHDKLHGIKMGLVSSDCDDGKTNLTVDWDYTPEDYACFTSSKITPNHRIKPILECERIPKYYVARHECMNKSIHYDVQIPTFGTHRPLWAKYGEYKYLPRQRWLHNLEHGAVVMLYHPCANPVEVNRLRNLVTRCLRRHVITPFAQLDEYRPLALVTWGCRLTMSTVSPKIVNKFIRQHALKGYEHTAREGQFDLGLQIPAKVVSDINDSLLCPR